MTTRTARTPADMLATLSSRTDWAAEPRRMHSDLAAHARRTMTFGNGSALMAEPPVAAYEPPPAGPDHEPEDDFQRRIDELLSERRPLWRDVAFWTCVLGIWSLGMAAACYLIAH